jgi:hypothetical protein
VRLPWIISSNPLTPGNKKGPYGPFLFTTGKKVLLVVDVHRDFETEADVAIARGIPFHDTHLRLVVLTTGFKFLYLSKSTSRANRSPARDILRKFNKNSRL